MHIVRVSGHEIARLRLERNVAAIRTEGGEAAVGIPGSARSIPTDALRRAADAVAIMLRLVRKRVKLGCMSIVQKPGRGVGRGWE